VTTHVAQEQRGRGSIQTIQALLRHAVARGQFAAELINGASGSAVPSPPDGGALTRREEATTRNVRRLGEGHGSS
jgi:hypothetical protein